MSDGRNPRERARRILATRAELEAIVAEGVLPASDPALSAIHAHHEVVLAGLVATGDVDLSREEERLSAGMRLATLLGATTLSIAWGMFATSLWDDLGNPARLALVWIPPVLLLAGTVYAATREPSGYVANIVATVATIAVAVAGFATVSLGDDFARWPFLLFGGYGLAVAYRYRLVLPLLVGVVGLGAWLWSLDSLLHGAPADQFEHTEPLALIGLAALATGLLRRDDPPEFRMAWQLAGVCATAVSLLLLGVWSAGSWFGRSEVVELSYQAIGLVVFVAMVYAGLRHDSSILARGGATALMVFLLFRMIDWFWDAIPDWLFFLLVGIQAFVVLTILRRLRNRGRLA